MLGLLFRDSVILSSWLQGLEGGLFEEIRKPEESVIRISLKSLLISLYPLITILLEYRTFSLTVALSLSFLNFLSLSKFCHFGCSWSVQRAFYFGVNTSPWQQRPHSGHFPPSTVFQRKQPELCWKPTELSPVIATALILLQSYSRRRIIFQIALHFISAPFAAYFKHAPVSYASRLDRLSPIQETSTSTPRKTVNQAVPRPSGTSATSTPWRPLILSRRLLRRLLHLLVIGDGAPLQTSTSRSP